MPVVRRRLPTVHAEPTEAIMPDVRFDRIDPTAGRNRLLAIADRTDDVYRATLGDASCVIVPDDGTLRIPWVQAGDDVRMRDLLDAVVEAVGSSTKTSRRIRFVCITTDDDADRAYRAALRKLGVPTTDRLEDVVHGGERVDEEWSPETHDVDETQTVPCLDVVWDTDR